MDIASCRRSLFLYALVHLSVDLLDASQLAPPPPLLLFALLCSAVIDDANMSFLMVVIVPPSAFLFPPHTVSHYFPVFVLFLPLARVDFRLMEAIASGALILVDRMFVPRWDPLIEGKHIVYYGKMIDSIRCIV
jgi:hypothetical protein